MADEAVPAHDALPVTVANPEPIAVEVVNGADKRRDVASSDGSMVSPPNTTEEQNRVSAGQRQINVMWERTQQILAILVSVVTLGACSYLVVFGNENMQVLAFALLSNICIMVMSTYYQRTNHTKTGGVGMTTGGQR